MSAKLLELTVRQNAALAQVRQLAQPRGAVHGWTPCGIGGADRPRGPATTLPPGDAREHVIGASSERSGTHHLTEEDHLPTVPSTRSSAAILALLSRVQGFLVIGVHADFGQAPFAEAPHMPDHAVYPVIART